MKISKRFSTYSHENLYALLNIKVDTGNKIVKIVNLLNSLVAKKMVRTKLVPRNRVRIVRWPLREPSVKFKIKTLLPEEKTIDIKRNGQVNRTIRVRRKTTKFTDRWARNFV